MSSTTTTFGQTCLQLRSVVVLFSLEAVRWIERALNANSRYPPKFLSKDYNTHRPPDPLACLTLLFWPIAGKPRSLYSDVIKRPTGSNFIHSDDLMCNRRRHKTTKSPSYRAHLEPALGSLSKIHSQDANNFNPITRNAPNEASQCRSLTVFGIF